MTVVRATILACSLQGPELPEGRFQRKMDKPRKLRIFAGGAVHSPEQQFSGFVLV